jgi:hypothetical protein
MNRVLTASRLQLVHPAVILGVPWAVVASSFVINWGVWKLADLEHQPGTDFTGGVAALYVTVAVVFVQAVTQLLPFAMGVSLSRRTYWLGVALVGVASAFGYGIALAVLSVIERATEGWWVGLEFWTPGPMRADNFFLQIAASGAPMLAFIFAGIAIGVVYKRWGQTGVWTLTIALLLFFGGLIVLVTGLHAWDEIGRWLTDQSLQTLAIGLPLALAAVVAGLSFRGIRRVVP